MIRSQLGVLIGILVQGQHSAGIEFLVVSLPPTINSTRLPKNSMGGIFWVFLP